MSPRQPTATSGALWIWLCLPTLACTNSGDSGHDTDVGDESTSTETGNGPDTEVDPARGIDIIEVEANQGVAISVGLDGEWVDGAARNGRLFSGRPTLVRVHHELGPGWVDREIEARLTLEDELGEQTQYTEVEYLSVFSTSTVFSFLLDPSLGETAPEIRYRVELFEVPGEKADEAAQTLEPQIAATPGQSPAIIGFEDIPATIEMVLVPIRYQGIAPTIDAEEVHDYLMSTLPVTEAEVEIHEPVDFEGQLNTLDQLLLLMTSVRSVDEAQPWVYYQAIIDTGEDSIDGDAAMARPASAAKSAADQRVGAVVFWPNWLEVGLRFTMLVNHGLLRTDCPDENSPTGSNPDYPYTDGLIGTWGYNVVTGDTYNPSLYYDMSAGCYPHWVSDYSWAKLFARIRTLTAWQSE